MEPSIARANTGTPRFRIQSILNNPISKSPHLRRCSGAMAGTSVLPGAGQSADIACLVSRCDWHFGVARQRRNPRDNVTSGFAHRNLACARLGNEACARSRVTRERACANVYKVPPGMRPYCPLAMNALWIISSQLAGLIENSIIFCQERGSHDCALKLRTVQ